jgi:hypothetical protein
MPDCCSTRHDFVLQKIRNMKAWLQVWTGPELSELYDENKAIFMITTGLLPLYVSGELEVGVNLVMEKLQGVPSDEVESVRQKVRRYLTCFCEALS